MTQAMTSLNREIERIKKQERLATLKWLTDNEMILCSEDCPHYPCRGDCYKELAMIMEKSKRR